MNQEQAASATAAAVLDALGSRPGGLDLEEVRERLARHGPNRLPEPRRDRLRFLRRQLQDPLVGILLAALALSIATPFLEGGGGPLHAGSFVDAVVIGAIVLLNAVLGISQEAGAERAIDELRRLHAPRARVRRGGLTAVVAAEEVVPGDVIVVDAGDRLVADARVLRVVHLAVDESSLTGEAEPIRRQVDPVPPGTDLAERASLLHAGSLVTRGSGEAVVLVTGASTVVGHIAALLEDAGTPPTPLQLRLSRLGRRMGLLALALCAVVVAVGLARGLPAVEVMLLALSLAVSAVPEGLPAVVTVCFALGVRRMARHAALVRRLDALETLGAVTVIASDKTGTLTENRMTVVEHRAAPGVTWPELATVLASCSHGTLPDDGDPTELALLAWAVRLGAPRLGIDDEEVPFSSEEKYMRTRHGSRSFLKGSPERVLGLCHEAPADAAAQAGALAEAGLRVLAAAVREGGVTRWVGVVGLADPPREGVREAVEEARGAGIRTLMITGDDPRTAAAVGRQVGVEGRVRTGRELDAMDAAALRQDVAGTAIYARVTPQHKVAICSALVARGEVVAMSGDGVNDAPALKQAHVGVAMGCGAATWPARPPPSCSPTTTSPPS